MRVVFMGTPLFAVPCLRALVQWDRSALTAVISQPDKPQGRGRSVIPTPVKAEAIASGIPVYQPAKVRSPEAQQLMQELRPDLVVVVAYGQILPRWFLDLPSRGCLNVHASLLPRYRGGAPLQRAVLNGETTTGITLMMMDEGMDTGPILCQTSLEIGPDETSGELAVRASAVGAEFLAAQLPALLEGRFPPRPQDSALATYAPLLKKEEGALRFGLDAAAVHNRIRAMNPWPIASCRLQEQLLLVHRSRLEPVDGAAGPPGRILEVGRDSILVACASGAVRLTQVQAPSKRVTSAGDFARGTRLHPGLELHDG